MLIFELFQSIASQELEKFDDEAILNCFQKRIRNGVFNALLETHLK